MTRPFTCAQALGYSAPNMRFVEGQIEDLAAAGIEDSSVDLVISNCVVGNKRPLPPLQPTCPAAVFAVVEMLPSSSAP